jgi:hypothetical protein
MSAKATAKNFNSRQENIVANVETVGATTEAGAPRPDFAAEEAFWRSAYPSRPYYVADVPFETYAAAYRHGWESRTKHPERTFADVEADLRGEWEKSEGGRQLDWDRARPAVSDAWDRTDVNLLGES